MTKVQTGSGHFTLATDLKVLSNHIFSDSAWLIPSILLIFIIASDFLSSATNQKFLANTFYVRGKTFAFVFQTNVFLIIILFLFRQLVFTFRDISLWYFTTYISTKIDFQNKRNDKIFFIVTELSPLFTKPLFRWAGQNYNRYQKSDCWNE